MQSHILGYDVYMTSKKRLTVTVDPELLEAGRHAVDSGDAQSISAWVAEALHEKVRRDEQLRMLDAAIVDFEREFGEITPDEITAQKRLDRERATVVRGVGRDVRRTKSA